ncbi:hypothetical protein ABIF69_001559 [Bradyrhizobium japonicum]
MGKAKIDLTPDAATEKMAAQPLPLARSPFRQEMAAQQESLRRIGEKLGMASVAETLRRIGEKLPKAEIAPPTPQEPTPHQPKRGRKPKFTRDQRQWLREQYSRDLKGNPQLALDKLAIPHVKQLAKTEFGIEAEASTLLKQVIRPVRRSVW